MNYFMFVGREENWKVSLSNKLWGARDATKSAYDKINIGDIAAFYVTMPYRKVIGFGRIKEKKIDHTLLWADEKQLNQSIWKYKISYDVLYLVNKWENGIELVKGLPITKGLQIVRRTDLFNRLASNADKNWGTNIAKLI